ncbi:MAG: sugar phosphate isomerase/epimerase family protein [Blastocatellia bacterium]
MKKSGAELGVTRRQFLGAAAVLPLALGGERLGLSQTKRPRLPLAFSTLGCPGWEWKKILGQAVEHGYSALELRGLLADVDITRSPQMTGAKIKESLADLNALGLKVSDLGASSRLAERDPARRSEQLDEARRYIELAHQLNSPYVRVFGMRAKDQPMEDAVARIVEGFQSLHEQAKGSGVTLLIESHDDFCESPTLLAILRGANLPTAQLLWDAHHTVVIGKESPAESYRQLGAYARHTHLKDSRAPRGEEKVRRYVLTGTGELPIRQTVEVLVKNKYPGYFCFEWEKRWHPTIEEPEVAIPHFARWMATELARAGYKGA